MIISEDPLHFLLRLFNIDAVRNHKSLYMTGVISLAIGVDSIGIIAIVNKVILEGWKNSIPFCMILIMLQNASIQIKTIFKKKLRKHVYR